MPQSATGKRRTALQVVAAVCISALLGACASTPDSGRIHPTSGVNAKTLRYAQTLDSVGLGRGDSFKTMIVGSDDYDLKRPVSLDVRDGIMLIADAGRDLILKYSFDTQRLTTVHGAGEMIVQEASDIFIAADHSFYVTDTDGKRVLHFAEDGSLLQEYRDRPNISRPISVTVNEDSGEVFIADEVYSKVVVFSHDGRPLRGMGKRGNGPGSFRIITDMMKVPGGYLVSDRVELSVQMLDESGQYLGHFGESELIFPSALAVDEYGRVFVGEKNESVIKVFQNGELIDVVGKNGYEKGEFRYVSRMKYYNKKLYVVDSLNGRIQVFDVLPPASQTQEQKVSALN